MCALMVFRIPLRHCPAVCSMYDLELAFNVLRRPRIFASVEMGNVVVLKDIGPVATSYEYGPFAEPLRATGPLAATNPLRFSTKYTDPETGPPCTTATGITVRVQGGG